MNSHIWIVQAHHTEAADHAEPSEILAVCTDEATALEYQRAWQEGQGSTDFPVTYITVSPQPLVTPGSPSPQHYFAMEWNEVLARMQVPCSDGLRRLYDRVLPTRVSVVRPPEADPSSPFSMQVMSQSPLIIVWYSPDEETVIQQWKQQDTNYLKAQDDSNADLLG